MTDGFAGLYGTSLALLTDLYQVTMAYGYWKAGVAEREAVFHLTFRRPPFGGGYAIAAGIEPALAYLERFAFDGSDLEYLAGLRDPAGQPLFEAGFVDHLATLRFTCRVDAVPEGSVVFAHEPLLRVEGPVLLGQLVETPLLNLVNFQTLIATKAARICEAARGGPVLEFGLRRAQGPDGALGASRAAYLGGCAATSNVLAGKRFGIPVRGTHAHSWVMFHDDERAAFAAYARAMPGNCTFLVDTYDTLEGVRHAVEIGRSLRATGHELAGIRLDSGDLAHLSIEARRVLDEAGFPAARIVASNDLDEALIVNLIEQGARIDVWGVGTKLATAFDQPALGGVYKLGAVRDGAGRWQHKLKLSEQPIKISNPGVLGVRRLRRDGLLVADVIYDVEAGPSPEVDGRVVLWDLEDPTRRIPIEPGEADAAEELLVPVLAGGRRLTAPVPLEEARARAARDRAALSPRTRRFLNPQPHRVGLDPHVHRVKYALIAEARGEAPEPR
jgi:nicotinate phosphoribosyltransferase